MKKKTTILSIFLAVFMALALNVGNVKAAATGQDIVNYAKRFQETQYVWGGTTPSGFDCSGFVGYVYRNCAGINLPRDTYGQINVGTPVSQSNLQPGDLVFPSIDHVGIYVGNGQMIHASSSCGKVIIGDVYAFHAGRRISGITNYSKEFIASVQRDLRKCRCYSGAATGVIDQQTKEGLYKFRRIVGLPLNTTLDNSVVTALNQIVQKPRLAVNTNLIYATRFVQWWIGHNIDGLYTMEMKESVRQWQIKAGIWGSSGADGVIREKDWNKILN